MTDDLRDQLADALHAGGGTCSACQADADVLLPLVSRLINQGAADALNEAAYAMDDWQDRAELLERAAALREANQ